MKDKNVVPHTKLSVIHFYVFLIASRFFLMHMEVCTYGAHMEKVAKVGLDGQRRRRRRRRKKKWQKKKKKCEA